MERQIQTKPLSLPRSRRRDEWRGLTSCRAGQIVPIAFFPLLREDSIRGRVSVQIKMAEAVHVIINPVRVTMQAHLIPKSALARFDGSLEVLNRSYMGETLPGGAAAPAWEVPDPSLATMGDDDLGHEIYDKLGVHYKSTTAINSDLLESYWTMVNWRRASVSKALPKVALTETKLAPAFWDSWKFDMIKPSFDAAMMEGEVPLNLNADGLPVDRLYAGAHAQASISLVNPDGSMGANNPTAGARQLYIASVGGAGAPYHVPNVDLATGEATISLANIATATQTRRMAQLRQQYQGIPDEYLIDMLMQGLNVPPEDFREPVLLSRGSAVIGQVERFATDGASLDQSVANGMAQLSLTINTPAIATGGMVLVTIEIVPEQLYERIHDRALDVKVPDDLPNALRDMLDPQKVEVVDNRYPDSFHSAPTGVFGYAPLNYQWQRNFARVGGKYKRPVPDTFVEERQRIWAVEKADPSLSADFYLCPDPFPHSVFADTAGDPFEVVTIGSALVTGLTVFGAGFMEDDDHYEKIMAQIDTSRIEQGGAAAADADASDDGASDASGDAGGSGTTPEARGGKSASAKSKQSAAADAGAGSEVE